VESQEPRSTFLVEQYRPDDGRAQLEHCLASLRAALRDLERQGEPVRFVCSVAVPDDESCLFVMEAASLALVQQTCARASIAPNRISIAVAETAGFPISHLKQTTSAHQEPERNTRC
jgi:hypothetical protein